MNYDEKVNDYDRFAEKRHYNVTNGLMKSLRFVEKPMMLKMMPNRQLFWNIPSSLKYLVYICNCIVMMRTYLLNRCLNHHLGKAKSIYNSYWERIRRRFPIKNCGLWWAKTAYGKSLRFLCVRRLYSMRFNNL